MNKEIQAKMWHLQSQKKRRKRNIVELPCPYCNERIRIGWIGDERIESVCCLCNKQLNFRWNNQTNQLVFVYN